MAFFSYASLAQTEKIALAASVIFFSTAMCAITVFGERLRDLIAFLTFLPLAGAYHLYLLLFGMWFSLLFCSVLWLSSAWRWLQAGAFALVLFDRTMTIGAGTVTKVLEYPNISRACLVHGPVDAR